MGTIPDFEDEDYEQQEKRYAIGRHHGNALLQEPVTEPQEYACGRSCNPGKAYVTGLPCPDHPVSLGEKSEGRQYSRCIAKIFCFYRHQIHVVVMEQMNLKIRNYREIVCWRVFLWRECAGGNKKREVRSRFFPL
jgi:hypothetical protein